MCIYCCRPFAPPSGRVKKLINALLHVFGQRQSVAVQMDVDWVYELQ